MIDGVFLTLIVLFMLLDRFAYMSSTDCEFAFFGALVADIILLLCLLSLLMHHFGWSF